MQTERLNYDGNGRMFVVINNDKIYVDPNYAGDCVVDKKTSKGYPYQELMISSIEKGLITLPNGRVFR